MSPEKVTRKVVEIRGDLADRVAKIAKEQNISDREAMDFIAKGEQTQIVSYFPSAFTKMIKKDLDSVDRNERVLAYQEISDASIAARNAQELTNSIKRGGLIDEKIIVEHERVITEKSKQEYYRSRDIDSQDRKEIRRIALEERQRLAGEKERGK